MIKHNKEQKLLAELATKIPDRAARRRDKWEGSTFRRFLDWPTRSRGIAGRLLVSNYLASKGYFITDLKGSSILVCNERFGVRTAFLDQNNKFTFNQLRDEDQKGIILVGIHPRYVYIWIVPKDQIIFRWKKTGEINPQHGGVKGSDTAMLPFEITNQPKWLSHFGGSPSVALGSLDVILDQ